MLKILYEDPEIIVVWKPVGMESQSSRGFTVDMVSEIKRHIHNSSPRGGEPYLAVIHRLDKPVSGILVYAKTKRAAAKLSKQVSDGSMRKKYLAVVCGKPVDNSDMLVDYLLKDEKINLSRIVEKGTTDAKRAELSYVVRSSREVESYGTLTLMEIQLLTGRHHQIRVQLAGHGMPLWGDNKYNQVFSHSTVSGHTIAPAHSTGLGNSTVPSHSEVPVYVALAAWELSFVHPVTGKTMTFQEQPTGEVFRIF